jgi:hypothetical protein
MKLHFLYCTSYARHPMTQSGREHIGALHINNILIESNYCCVSIIAGFYHLDSVGSILRSNILILGI